MKVTILLFATALAVCAPALGFDWSRTEHLLRELRMLEELEERSPQTERVCYGDADLVFVLDRSRSIYPPDFTKALQFVQSVIRLFDAPKSRFAVISFAEGATIDFDLTTYGLDQDATLNAVANLKQREDIGGQTNTWAALQLLYTKVLTRPMVRPGVKPTVVLITDGASQESERTAQEAKNAHAKGIKIIVIGIGKEPKIAELNAIASDPDSVNVHKIENYNEALNAIRITIATELCPGNIENCTNNKPLDVMWSVSEHANKAEVSATFKFMKDVMAKVVIGPGAIQFGLGRMDCGNQWDQISLNEIDSWHGFSMQFRTRLSGYSNGLAQRLSYLGRSAFTQGDQPKANNVAVVFIDRKSDLDAEVRRIARTMGHVHLIIIAGGGIRASDVSGITADLIFFTSYATIGEVKEALLTKLCEAEEHKEQLVIYN